MGAGNGSQTMRLGAGNPENVITKNIQREVHNASSKTKGEGSDENVTHFFGSYIYQFQQNRDIKTINDAKISNMIANM